MKRPPLTIKQILAWADAHHAQNGKWPNLYSGPVQGAPGELWHNISNALYAGMRGLGRKRITLAQLLAKHRGVRNQGALSKLTVRQICDWAEDHHRRTGQWPTDQSGPIPGTDETWLKVNMALFRGRRGLEKSTLALVLAKEFDAANSSHKPLPSSEQILRWADEYYERTGKWPTATSGPIADSGGYRWTTVNNLLRSECNSTLCLLLNRERGVPHPHHKIRLSISRILAWADEHHERTGQWPAITSGQVTAAPEVSWWLIDRALANGKRGLSGGTTLLQLLAQKRGRPIYKKLPPLSLEDIRDWARAYKRKHGQWPNRRSGPIEGVPGETWLEIWVALYKGCRGLESHKRVSDAFCD